MPKGVWFSVHTMDEPVKYWQRYQTWNEAEQAWDKRAARLQTEHPLRTFKVNPRLPGIRRHTRKHLTWKTLSYIQRHDYSGKLGRYFWRRPLKHAWGLIRSLACKQLYRRDGDLFFYRFGCLEDVKSRLIDPNAVLVIGFSYCHKPFECPAGRFTDACVRDLDSPVCGQCFIGKCVHALPDARVEPLFITTVHYIGEKMIEAHDRWPDREILFLITACELTLEMFGKLGHAVGFQGVGVRLDGQICNTMPAFKASERGLKPGMAVVNDDAQADMMALIRAFADSVVSDSRTVSLASTPPNRRDHIIASDRRD